MANLFDKIQYLHLPYVVYDGTKEMAEQIGEWCQADYSEDEGEHSLQEPNGGSSLNEGDVIIQVDESSFMYFTAEMFEDMKQFKNPVLNDFEIKSVDYIRGDQSYEIVDVWTIERPDQRITVRVFNDQGIYYSVIIGIESYEAFRNGDTSARVFCGNDIQAYDYIRRLQL